MLCSAENRQGALSRPNQLVCKVNWGHLFPPAGCVCPQTLLPASVHILFLCLFRQVCPVLLEPFKRLARLAGFASCTPRPTSPPRPTCPFLTEDWSPNYQAEPRFHGKSVGARSSLEMATYCNWVGRGRQWGGAIYTEITAFSVCLLLFSDMQYPLVFPSPSVHPHTPSTLLLPPSLAAPPSLHPGGLCHPSQASFLSALICDGVSSDMIGVPVGGGLQLLTWCRRQG